MAKSVGYACALKLSWLNKAAEMRKENLSVADYKSELNEYLSFEIAPGTVRLRKARDLLMNIWYYETEETKQIHTEAEILLAKYPEYAPAIHLCMIYMAYPVFADICKYMGRIFEFQDDVTNAQLTQRLFDEWGERGSLEATCRRVSLTLKELGLLKAITKFKNAPVKTAIAKYDLISFLLSITMKIDNGSYYSFIELNGFNQLFPFEFAIAKEQLMTDDHFIVTNFGGEMTVALK